MSETKHEARAEGESILPGLLEVALGGSEYKYVMHDTYCRVSRTYRRGPEWETEVLWAASDLPGLRRIVHDSRSRTITFLSTNRLSREQWTAAWYTVAYHQGGFPYREAAELNLLRSDAYNPDMFCIRDRFKGETGDECANHVRVRYGNEPFQDAQWIEYRGQEEEPPSALRVRYRPAPTSNVTVGNLKFNFAAKYDMGHDQVAMKLFDLGGRFVWEHYWYLWLAFRVAAWDVDGDGADEIVILSAGPPSESHEKYHVAVVLGQTRNR